MKKYLKQLSTSFLISLSPVLILHGQSKTELTNVFLGSSGDHGQLSPAASSPFHQMSIAPQTYPTLHMGYEHLAKEILGFTHNRFEGVGCKGSGGLILVKPFLGLQDDGKPLIKEQEKAGPGYYDIALKSRIKAQFAVHENFGIHQYTFPAGEKGLTLDLAHAFNGAFVSNTYTLTKDGVLKGTIRSRTTCGVGIYSVQYAIAVANNNQWKGADNLLTVQLDNQTQKVTLRIAFSAVSTDYAEATLKANSTKTYAQVKAASDHRWETYLSGITVKGDPNREKLFYSLLYRTLQSPYQINESDGHYRGTDGQIHQSKGNRYHGWAIWDNYKTQLPLLELLYPQQYQNIVSSVSDLYRYGKFDFAGPNEPANSVRTEHAAVVLLDASKKGYDIHLSAIRDSLVRDTMRFDFSKPDKYLEAAYDMWAMADLLPADRKHYLDRASSYAGVWLKEFKDLTRPDVDRMSARNMYQGTIRQYRWNVPFDMQGLVTLAGGKEAFTAQLDDFFDHHYFNRANEPDIQSPTSYYASSKPSRYQSLVRELALDTVIQYYFNDNSRGIDPFIDRIYKNQPKAFVRTMDDDAGAMSGWFVLTALGLHQPLIGQPIYYVSVPLFPEIVVQRGEQKLKIKVINYNDKNKYVKRILLNGKDIDRLWLHHDELRKGGLLEIEASAEPSTYGTANIWVSDLKE
ncbi:glycoside hydrolase domain-containing protein [Sphingobacterium faecium]|uniref:glycoside hydrolase domain-containing protein n=1 Tax=Sphingobacterium faecium TaxID=34087 RepID=UPI0004E5F9AF|nr:glycoside hydrolase domain-containing protein [Sphingobacterium faecium]UXD71486.1 glycoside hydrolase family 92 protein [Sphingobacterium faecium]WGQ15136.1 glycoside hydrolase family 92 protein [Sphingobacterium faecium]CDS92509.1 putative alpha-1,2-mannosidase [Sphingobacterium sp. PM2-P1-29]SJN25370.1 Alpha-1,2-mannosidase [Sphingobacterium faecium PCAi_F2.5]